MEVLFLKLVNLSLTAGWLVLAVVALRLIFRKAPRWIFCALWGLVALRLICPVSVESVLSLIPSSEPLPQDIIYTAEPYIDSGIDVVDRVVNPVLMDSLGAAGHLTSVNPTQVWSFILSRVWAVGTAVMLAYAFVSFLMLKRRVCTATLLHKGVKQSERVVSPFVLGVFRPVVYLPYGISGDDLEHVLAHEQAHIRRRDHWWKPVGFLLLSVYWFNPLMWVAYVLLCRDIEAACDEKVIKGMKKDLRRAYSTALLNCSVHRRSIAACPLAFGETGVKSRIKNVMNYKKPAFWTILLAVVAAIIAAVCLLTNPADSGEEKPNDAVTPSPVISGKEETVSVEWIATDPDMATGDAATVFFVDETNLYWVSDTGHNRFVYYSDGTKEEVGQALWNGKIEISDLDRFNLKYSVDPKERALPQAVRNTLRMQNVDIITDDFCFVSFVELAREEQPGTGINGDYGKAKVWGIGLCQRFDYPDDTIQRFEEVFTPFVVEFRIGGYGYHDVKYWSLRDSTAGHFEEDVRRKFPDSVQEEVLNYQKYYLALMQDCYAQAVPYGVQYMELDPEHAVEKLLEQIETDPLAVSNLNAYLATQPETYQELLYYGNYTRVYCLKQFAQSDQNGLRGELMRALLKDLAAEQG